MWRRREYGVHYVSPERDTPSSGQEGPICPICRQTRPCRPSPRPAGRPRSRREQQPAEHPADDSPGLLRSSVGRSGQLRESPGKGKLRCLPPRWVSPTESGPVHHSWRVREILVPLEDASAVLPLGQLHHSSRVPSGCPLHSVGRRRRSALRTMKRNQNLSSLAIGASPGILSAYQPAVPRDHRSTTVV